MLSHVDRERMGMKRTRELEAKDARLRVAIESLKAQLASHEADTARQAAAVRELERKISKKRDTRSECQRRRSTLHEQMSRHQMRLQSAAEAERVKASHRELVSDPWGELVEWAV